MLTIKYHTAFKKDYKRVVKRGYDIHLMEKVIGLLTEQEIKEFDIVLLKDGREAAIVEVLSDTVFIADVGSSIKDWETIDVISDMIERKLFPTKYKDHALTGDYMGYQECHITPDWLLVYELRQDELILILTRTGTHSDLF